MSRRRAAAINDNPSLFPFLAVLICTVGALVVLLVVMIRQSRVEAAAQTDSRKEAADEARLQARWEVEEWEWKSEMLREDRQQFLDDLARRRSELSHLEDHRRRVEQEADQLVRAVERLQELQKERAGDSKSIQAEIDALAQATREAESVSVRLRQQARQRKPAYAIVPYVGSHGTRRQPIYVECLADRIVLQPTGVTLLGSDFDPPLDVDNPLAAAIRATSEYLAREGVAEKHAAPYPLLIVRPDGAESYAAARYALRSWESAFGYELVPGDMKISYPPSDPQLADLQQRVLADLRGRRIALQKAVPNRNALQYGLRASPNGGFVAMDRSASERTAPRRGGRGTESMNSTRVSARLTSARSGPPIQRHDGTEDVGNTRSSGDSWVPGKGGGNRTIRQGSSSNQPSAYPGNGDRTGDVSGDGTDIGSDCAGQFSTTNTENGQRSADGQQSAYGQRSANGDGRDVGRSSLAQGNSATGESIATVESPAMEDAASGYEGGGPVSGTGAPSRTRGGTASTGSAPTSSASTSSAARGNLSNGSSAGSLSAQGMGSGASGASGPSVSIPDAASADTSTHSMPTDGVSAVYQPQSSSTLSHRRNSRQKNWALPANAGAAIPLSRPIYAQLDVEQLQLLPDQRTQFTGQRFDLRKGFDPVLESFIAEVKRQIQAWGMAGNGIYWRPVLHVQVASGADAGFQELEDSLQESGIVLKRAQP